RFVDVCLRAFLLLRLIAFSAPQTVHQIFQIATDDFFEQICLRPFDCSADFEIDGGITRLLRWLEVRPDWLKKLRANFFVDGQPRAQMQFAAKTHSAGGREM